MSARVPDDGGRTIRPPVWSVEWNLSEQVFRVDGHEYRRERGGVSQSHQHVVRSVLTSDYEVIEVSEVTAVLELVGARSRST